jgi:hypothetical protein
MRLTGTTRGMACAWLLLLFLRAQGAAQEPAHWESLLPRGPHAVGLDTILLRDSTRAFSLEGVPPVGLDARPIRVLIWRPTIASSQRPLRYGAYAELVGFEGRERVVPAATGAARGRREMADYLISLGADSARAVLALELPMLARYGASAEPGRFPLVLLAVGKDDSPVLHAVAGEYLASHGFVVVGFPGLGADQRAMQWTAADLRAQASDLAFVRDWAGSVHGVQADRLGILAFSFGSGSALVAARRDCSIAAIVSFDGSIGFADRLPIHRALPELTGGPLHVHVLHVNVAGIPRNDLTLLREIAGDLTIVGFPGAGHLDFTTLASLSASVPGLTLSRLGDDAWASPGNVHAAALIQARGYLETHLRRRTP